MSQNISLEIPKAQIQQFLKLLRKSQFWKLQSEGPTGGDDGAMWILEGVQGASYHITDRRSPNNDDYSSLCLYMLKLSGIIVPAKEIY